MPYLRLAARHCDLIYGDTLRPAPEGTLAVDARGGREVWWQRYVRVLEPAPGKRVYLVHLINPPVKPGVDIKNTLPPPPATDSGAELVTAARLESRTRLASDR